MKYDKAYLNWLQTYLAAKVWAPVGSTYILGDGEDVDVLFLVENLSEASEFLNRKGWESDSEAYEEVDFLSFRNNLYNVLITQDVDFFNNFVKAANVCKMLQVKDRDGRIAIHRELLYTDPVEDIKIERELDEILKGFL